jgi:hypothetical protein
MDGCVSVMRLKLGLSKSYHDPLRSKGKLRGAQGFVRWQRKMSRSEVVVLSAALCNLNLNLRVKKVKVVMVVIETREIDAHRHLSGYRSCL